MNSSNHHSYLPLSKYVCTLTAQCFIQSASETSHHSIMKRYKQNIMATFEDFTLKKETEQFITAQTTTKGTAQSDKKCTQQTHQPVVVIDENAPDKKPLPKWMTINAIILYESDKESLLSGEWLSDQHVNVAQSLLR